jgi:hypothetical protein
MASNPYSVSVVLDRCFGDRLITLAQDGPVWIIDSAQNREVVNICWNKNPVLDHLVGITLFKGLDTTSPEDLLIGNLGTIDLHHGEYSAPIPYSILEIIGASRTPAVEAELAEYGFDRLEDTSDGFRAVRTLSEL